MLSKEEKKAKFLARFPFLVELLINDVKQFSLLPQSAIEWIQELFKYTVDGGKMNRGIAVIDTVEALVDRNLTDKELDDAIVCGWCIEWLQAYFLVADDFMDTSVTRRGKPCWYRRPEVGVIAVNDSFILESAIYRLLKLHFGDLPVRMKLIDIFQEVSYITQLGQLLDLTAGAPGTGNGKEKYALFTMETYKSIVVYKTAFYTFYLPVALGLTLHGSATPEKLQIIRPILTEMGQYFQIQDDVLDCFGTPEQIGKVGTDIEDFKCSWLAVQALTLMSDEQKEIFYANYGSKESAQVQKIKDLYKSLQLFERFQEYENNSYTKLNEQMAACKDIPMGVFTMLLSKIYKRKY